MKKLLVLIPMIIVIVGCGGIAPESTAAVRIISKINKFGASSPFVVGHKLSTTNGEWKNSPTSFTYQWQDCNLSGEACVNIAGAVNSSYILTSGDVGHTIRVLVKATNSGGSTTQTSSTTPEIKNVVTEESKTCSTTVSNSSALSGALASGQTICLSSGSYSINLNNKNFSSPVVVQPSAGATVSLGYTEIVNSSNIYIKEVSIGGGLVGSTTQVSTHIHFIKDNFTGSLCINTPTNINQDTLIEKSKFLNLGQSCTEGRLGISGNNINHSVKNGIVVTGSLIGEGGAADGIQINGGAYGTQIGPGNIFTGIIESKCGSVHCDPIQFYGAKNTIITGNYFYNDSSQIESPDGNGSPMFVNNNVFVQFANPIQIGGGNSDVFEHNTIVGAMEIGHENVGASNNETIKNNIITNGFNLNGGQTTSGWTLEYNLMNSGNPGTNGISGLPTFIGGSKPSSWSGYALSSSSLGYLKASDKTSMGTAYFGE